jgi:psp operon transcriptional activator
VRELKNVVERAVYRAKNEEIETIDTNPFGTLRTSVETEGPTPAPSAAASPAPADGPGPPAMRPDFGDLLEMGLPAAVWRLKVDLLESALGECRYHQQKTARRLGLSYNQFRGLYRKYKTWRRDRPRQGAAGQ